MPVQNQTSAFHIAEGSLLLSDATSALFQGMSIESHQTTSHHRTKKTCTLSIEKISGVHRVAIESFQKTGHSIHVKWNASFKKLKKIAPTIAESLEKIMTHSPTVKISHILRRLMAAGVHVARIT